jgi:hypothetical protein
MTHRRPSLPWTVAATIRAAVESVNGQLAARVSAQDLTGFHRALDALGGINDETS